MIRLARLTVLLPFMLVACGTPPKPGGSASSTGAASSQPELAPEEAAKRRADILAIRDKTLSELFEQKPETREELQKAAGYAVFDSSQYNIVLLVGAKGVGVLVDNATQTPTFMLAARAGTGPGIGYKSFRQVMIFKSKEVLHQFRTVGADVTASADATAKLKGGDATADLAASFNPYISMYQFTDRGVVLQANWGGAAYLPDEQLNRR